jgi:protein O-GlcNAc transferase
MLIGLLLISLVCFPLASGSLWAQKPAATADQQWKTHISSGINLLRQQKFDLAKQQFLLATQRAKTRAEGFIYLGLASLNLGQQREAEQAFRQALLLEPRSAQAHYNLGLIYSTQNRHSEAVQELKQAVALVPRHPDGLYNLGVLLLEGNNALEAAQYLERAAQLGPASAELSANLIRAYLGAGKVSPGSRQRLPRP